jgi:hypothetical protein
MAVLARYAEFRRMPISDLPTCPLWLEDLRELESRNIVETTENPCPHAFVDDRSLSLIVCGACR